MSKRELEEKYSINISFNNHYYMIYNMFGELWFTSPTLEDIEKEMKNIYNGVDKMENKNPYSNNLIIEMESILRKLLREVPNEFVNDVNMLKDITTRLDAIILTLKELLNERLN